MHYCCTLHLHICILEFVLKLESNIKPSYIGARILKESKVNITKLCTKSVLYSYTCLYAVACGREMRGSLCVIASTISVYI